MNLLNLKQKGCNIVSGNWNWTVYMEHAYSFSFRLRKLSISCSSCWLHCNTLSNCELHDALALRYNHAFLSKCMSKKRNAEKRGLLLLQIYFTFHGRVHVTEKSSCARHFLAMLVVTRTSGSICSRCVNALGNTHVNKINRAVRWDCSLIQFVTIQPFKPGMQALQSWEP